MTFKYIAGEDIRAGDFICLNMDTGKVVKATAELQKDQMRATAPHDARLGETITFDRSPFFAILT